MFISCPAPSGKKKLDVRENRACNGNIESNIHSGGGGDKIRAKIRQLFVKS